jgi:hypothetical protein
VQIITLLVAGPIRSRLSKGFTLQDLEISLRAFKIALPGGKIVVSTYEAEFPPEFHDLVDSIVINEDPGIDYFQANPWPIASDGRGNGANYKRLMSSTLAGLKACDEGFVIKTRVELLPQESEVFSSWLRNCLMEFESNSTIKIGFFLEHYSGISFSINGLLGGIPDTLQIGRKADLVRIWEKASLFWRQHSNILTRKSKRFPLTSEQLIGMSFLHEFYGFNIDKRVGKLGRYYRSLGLVRVIIQSEKQAFFWSSYKSSGFESDYLKKSFSLDLSGFSIPRTPWALAKKLSLVQAKAVYHHYRRYLVGLRRIRSSKNSA